MTDTRLLVDCTSADRPRTAAERVRLWRQMRRRQRWNWLRRLVAPVPRR
jgi:hypothetical protein